MHKIIKKASCILISLFLTIFSLSTYALDDNWYEKNNDEVNITVNMFMSSQCPHCHKASDFFADLEKKQPWLKINRHVINESNQSLKTFYEYLQHFLSNDFAVPQFFFCDSRWVGFINDESTGVTLFEAMNFCRDSIKRQGNLTENTVKVLREKSDLYNKQ